jgi:hypothetical protein
MASRKVTPILEKTAITQSSLKAVVLESSAEKGIRKTDIIRASQPKWKIRRS